MKSLYEGNPIAHAEFALELSCAFMLDLLAKPELEHLHEVFRINLRHSREALEDLRKMEKRSQLAAADGIAGHTSTGEAVPKNTWRKK